MKSKAIKITVMALVISAISCNNPETVVTDILHPDGSVTRKIEIRNSANDFKVKDVQVPYDSTWLIRDSIEYPKKGDTVWIRRAEKKFASVDELNQLYSKDSSYNKSFKRHVGLKKKFRWFNTDYLFEEIIESKMKYAYPASDFYSAEELQIFYLPNNLWQQKRNGPDSLKYKLVEESMAKKNDLWVKKSFISEWIHEFSALLPAGTDKSLGLDSLKAREDYFMTVVQKHSDNFDSLWKSGLILEELINETNAQKYRREADSAGTIALDRVVADFRDYQQKIVMPGKLIGTNGFADSTLVLQWPVKSDLFFAEPYRMWAESKITNTWAWIVTGCFLVFVAAGLIIRRIRRK
ncbi:MAG: hypothetical protein U0T33_10500 [Bacteroidales bacterium]